MKNYKKGMAIALAAVTATTAAVALTACSNTTGGNTEKTPFIKEVVILNEPETYYLYGDTFDEGDFALQEIYSDGTKKTVTTGYEFKRKQVSVLVDESTWTYEDQDVELDAPLTRNDNEIYIEYKTTCQGYNLTYNLTQPLTTLDPSSADTAIFTVGSNDKVYFYGDGHVESYGIQLADYVHIPGYGASLRNDGLWSWDGKELVIVMQNKMSGQCADPTAEYREIVVNKNADGTYTFHFEWCATSEKVGEDDNGKPLYKTYTFGGTISDKDVKRRLTPNTKFGADQELKGKYPVQTDIK